MRRALRLLLSAAAVMVLVVALYGAVALGLHQPVLAAVGRFLIVEDPLQRSDVIVVLSGGRRDERVCQGADLYKAGYAPLVLLSGGEEWTGAPIVDLLWHHRRWPTGSRPPRCVSSHARPAPRSRPGTCARSWKPAGSGAPSS